ncbi:MAG TPA: RNA 2',3'-cyclic phosphodiesterase [Bacteriovoracaceae bacterium]|nr:RNA 2',3'-cyclic phosphodiesterase [Bacteriovoracaceae bacterium]
MRSLLTIDAHQMAIDLKNSNLKKLKTGLARKNLEFKFTDPAQWHIPLLFFQDMGKEKFAVFDTILRQTVSSFAAFDLSLDGIRAWPEQKEARLIWIGVQNSKDLRFLKNVVLRDLSELGEGELEGSGEPYLPLVRLKNHKNVTDIISPFKNSQFGTLRAKKLIAYEMTSGGAFPTYRKISEYPLITAERTNLPAAEGSDD